MKRKNLYIDLPNDLMEQYVAETARQIQEEIDFQIISDMLVTMGWHKLQFDPLRDSWEAQEIQDWLKVNCKGKYQSRGETWLFENAKDAAWFTLRWGEVANV